MPEVANQPEPACRPAVGIVLVNYNGMKFLPDCLHSLAVIDYPALITLVDNASSDGSADWAEAHFPDLLLLRQNTNDGFAAANNIGIRECLARGCDYVLLLNNDTTVAPDFLSRLMAEAAPNRLLAPKIYYYDTPAIINNHLGAYDLWRGLHRDWFFGQTDTPASLRIQPVRMANGCALLVPKGIIERVGLLDETFFMYYEDVDYILRAVRAGCDVWFVPPAVVYHRESSSSGGTNSPLSVYYNNRNRLFLMFKHQKNPFARLFFLGYFTLTRLATFAVYAARGQWPQFGAMRRALSDFCRGKTGYVPQVPNQKV